VQGVFCFFFILPVWAIIFYILEQKIVCTSGEEVPGCGIRRGQWVWEDKVKKIFFVLFFVLLGLAMVASPVEAGGRKPTPSKTPVVTLTPEPTPTVPVETPAPTEIETGTVSPTHEITIEPTGTDLPVEPTKETPTPGYSFTVTPAPTGTPTPVFEETSSSTSEGPRPQPSCGFEEACPTNSHELSWAAMSPAGDSVSEFYSLTDCFVGEQIHVRLSLVPFSIIWRGEFHPAQLDPELGLWVLSSPDRGAIVVEGTYEGAFSWEFWPELERASVKTFFVDTWPQWPGIESAPDWWKPVRVE
jgi:hypothetical protein